MGASASRPCGLRSRRFSTRPIASPASGRRTECSTTSGRTPIIRAACGAAPRGSPTARAPPAGRAPAPPMAQRTAHGVRSGRCCSTSTRSARPRASPGCGTAPGSCAPARWPAGAPSWLCPTAARTPMSPVSWTSIPGASSHPPKAVSTASPPRDRCHGRTTRAVRYWRSPTSARARCPPPDIRARSGGCGAASLCPRGRSCSPPQPTMTAPGRTATAGVAPGCSRAPTSTPKSCGYCPTALRRFRHRRGRAPWRMPARRWRQGPCTSTCPPPPRSPRPGTGSWSVCARTGRSRAPFIRPARCWPHLWMTSWPASEPSRLCSPRRRRLA